MASHGLGETVVRFPSEFHSLDGFELFGSRRREREHLHVDAGGVHLRDTLVSEIAQLFEEFRRATAKSLGLLFQLASGPIEKGLGGEMFFEGYGSHIAASARQGIDRKMSFPVNQTAICGNSTTGSSLAGCPPRRGMRLANHTWPGWPGDQTCVLLNSFGGLSATNLLMSLGRIRPSRPRTRHPRARG